MTYCISDIHGCYDEFMELLNKIAFSPGDALYILGDVVDRGPESLKCLQYIMEAPNIYLLMGNHERMMLDELTGDCERDTPSVLPGFMKLSMEERLAIIGYLRSLPYTAEVKIGEQSYLLVHAGLDVEEEADMSTANVLSRQCIEDMVWIREEFYDNKALSDSIVVFGHTPTPGIADMTEIAVWHDTRFHDKIGIDGGCVFGGKLLALRLDDMAEFEVESGVNDG